MANLLLMKCILIIFFVYLLFCVILKKMYPNRRRYQFNILFNFVLFVVSSMWYDDVGGLEVDADVRVLVLFDLSLIHI